MPEQKIIPEKEAYELMNTGLRMAQNDGGETTKKMYPLFSRDLVGYGLSFQAGGLSTKEAKSISKSFLQFLEDDYVYSAYIHVSRYLTSRGTLSPKKNSLRISNRSSGRRTEVYMTPNQLPPPNKLTAEEAIEDSINEMLSSSDSMPLSMPLPWESEVFYKKELPYAISDLMPCGDFAVDVRTYFPNFFDLLNVTYNSGMILAKKDIGTKEKRFAKVMKSLLMEKFQKVSWGDIAGYDYIKDEFRMKLQGPMLNEALYKSSK